MEEDRKKYKIMESSTPCNGCSSLQFMTVPANRPSAITAEFWAQATAEGELCGDGNSGHIQVSAQGLVPLGVYTLWFLTNKGAFPAAPVGATYTADGYDPNRLVVNGDGILNYYIAPLDFNPFKGIPTAGGVAKISKVAIAFNSDRMTYGQSPGTPGVNVFDQLIAPVCHPRD